MTLNCKVDPSSVIVDKEGWKICQSHKFMVQKYQKTFDCALTYNPEIQV